MDKYKLEKRLGYNLGTTDPKLHKQISKPYHFDAILTRKTMEIMIWIEPEKEFE